MSDVMRTINVSSLCRHFGYQPLPLDMRSGGNRRLFFGALISYESASVLHLLAEEIAMTVDVVVFVESNLTHRGIPQPWYYTANDEKAAARMRALTRIFSGMRVAVHRYVEEPLQMRRDGMGRDLSSREIIPSLWAREGMRPSDVGIMADTDETFSRAFMRAMRECDVPQLRSRRAPGPKDADCAGAKISGRTTVFEGSLDCRWLHRRWFHPDAILGECIEHVASARPPNTSLSHQYDEHGLLVSWGKHYGGADWHAFESHAGLWSGADMKMRSQKPIFRVPTADTAFHFHNFFASLEVLQKKYFSYAHYDPNDRASSAEQVRITPKLHEDIDVMLRCRSGADDHRRHSHLYNHGWSAYLQHCGDELASLDVPRWLCRNHADLASTFGGTLVANPATRALAKQPPLPFASQVSPPPPLAGHLRYCHVVGVYFEQGRTSFGEDGCFDCTLRECAKKCTAIEECVGFDAHGFAPAAIVTDAADAAGAPTKAPAADRGTCWLKSYISVAPGDKRTTRKQRTTYFNKRFHRLSANEAPCDPRKRGRSSLRKIMSDGRGGGRGGRRGGRRGGGRGGGRGGDHGVAAVGRSSSSNDELQRPPIEKLLDADNDKPQSGGGGGGPPPPLTGSAVVTVITNRRDLYPFRTYAGSLRATGYDGHLLLGVSADVPRALIEYLREKRATVYGLREVPCSLSWAGSVKERGGALRQRRTCEGLDWLPIEWGRFALAAVWLRTCVRCTSWAIITDGTDVFFQAPPFAWLREPRPSTWSFLSSGGQQVAADALYVVPEWQHTIEHWFTATGLSRCYRLQLPAARRAMLNVGAVYGTRAAMLTYLDTLVGEFSSLLANTSAACRPPHMNDQTVLNMLYYTGRLVTAVPSVTVQPAWNLGVVQTVGSGCARVVNGTHIDGLRDIIQTDSAGFVLNADGQRAPVVHQWDRCFKWIHPWVMRAFGSL